MLPCWSAGVVDTVAAPFVDVVVLVIVGVAEPDESATMSDGVAWDEDSEIVSPAPCCIWMP